MTNVDVLSTIPTNKQGRRHMEGDRQCPIRNKFKKSSFFRALSLDTRTLCQNIENIFDTHVRTFIFGFWQNHTRSPKIEIPETFVQIPKNIWIFARYKFVITVVIINNSINIII